MKWRRRVLMAILVLLGLNYPRSFFYWDWGGFPVPGADMSAGVVTGNGELVLVIVPRRTAEGGTLNAMPGEWIDNYVSKGIRFLQFTAGSGEFVAIGVPYWFLMALIFLRWWMIPKPRPPEGFCPICGYDLRATPDRCPECGCQPATTSPPLAASPNRSL